MRQQVVPQTQLMVRDEQGTIHKFSTMDKQNMMTQKAGGRSTFRVIRMSGMLNTTTERIAARIGQGEI